MFKNILDYGIGGDFSVDAAAMETALSAARFVACGASEEKSVGWVEPRGEEHGLLVESVAGHLILKFMVETRSIPPSEVDKQAKIREVEIEAQTGRKPGKKEMNDVKDQIRIKMMNRAFSKESHILVWLDPVNRRLVVGAGSPARADDVLSLLVTCVDGLAVMPIKTKVSASAAMSHWLVSQEPPSGFSVDRECVLKAADESKATIKYGKHPLDIEEVGAHVEGGKLLVQLAMTWDDRVSFVLTENLQIKKLDFLDSVFEFFLFFFNYGFDADVAIFTGEMVKLLPDLFDALGGTDTNMDEVAAA